MRVVRGQIILMASLAAALFFCFQSGSARANPAARKVRKGNKLYAEKKYDQALASYGEAQQENPTAPEIYFNIGNVQYRKKDYPKAASLFEKSGRDRNRLLKSKAYYNMGNTYFKAEDLAKALAAYKKSIEFNPKDRDAKFNYELTRLRQQQQQKQQQQKKKEKKPPPPKPKPSPGEKQQQEKQQPEPRPSGSPRQTPAPRPQPQKLSKEDVDRLLNALQNQEENRRQEIKRRETSSAPEVLKDW